MSDQQDRPRPVEDFEIIRPSGERLRFGRRDWRERWRERVERPPRRKRDFFVELGLMVLAAFGAAVGAAVLFTRLGAWLWTFFVG